MFLHAIHLKGIAKANWYVQLLFEASIRLITFKWYYLKSLTLFLENLGQVAKSEKAFEALSFKQGQDKSVKEVIDKITKSFNAKDIRRF